eukprot:m.238854 g.238854  ORF g.238854 m.238854 type:complete len:876 (-) comp17431_c0_seq2:1743-4370(-)
MASGASSIHQGMMRKRAQGKSKFGRMSWKERFFVLTNAELSYWEGFGGHDNPDSKLKSKIQTVKIVAAEEVELSAFKIPYMMQIVYDGGVLYCQAQSLKDRTEWLTVLRQTIKDNPTLNATYHPGMMDGKWTCCSSKDKSKQGCKPAFDYGTIGRAASNLASSGGSRTRLATDDLPDPTGGARSQPLPPVPEPEPEPAAGADAFEVVAQFPYQQMEPTDLPMVKGEKLTILDASEEHWWKARNASGKEGFVPANYVRKLGMESEPWFMGSVSKSEASALLNVSGQDGCFLVRESESQPGQYSLSVFYKGKLKHYRIKVENSKHYVSDRHRFDTITDLIEYHKLNSGGLVTRLRKPVNDQQPMSATLGHDKWELDHHEIELGRELGSGNFGVVRQGRYKGTTDVAIKMMKPGSMSEDDFIAEAQVMMKFRHKNLVDLLGVCTSIKPIYLVTELMTNGSLLDHLKTNAGMFSSQPNILHYMGVQIASGMKFLEDHGFIHRDLAARNCLVGENNIVKVADFGLARAVTTHSQVRSENNKGYYRKVGEVVAALRWMPPEVFTTGVFEELSDVWAFGVTVWEIFSWGALPYGHLAHDQVIENVLKGVRLKQPDSMPTILHMLCKKCWAPERPRFASILTFLERVFAKFELPVVPIAQRQHPEDRLMALNALTPQAERRTSSRASAEQAFHRSGPKLPRASSHLSWGNSSDGTERRSSWGSAMDKLTEQVVPTIHTEQAAAAALLDDECTLATSTSTTNHKTSIPLPSAMRFSPGFEPRSTGSTRPSNTTALAQSTGTSSYVPMDSLPEVKSMPVAAAPTAMPASQLQLKQSNASLQSALTGPSGTSILSGPLSRSASPILPSSLQGYLQVPGSKSKSTIV